MLKRILILLLAFVLVTGLVSCNKANKNSDLTVLTDVKGIPDDAEDLKDNSDKNDGEDKGENEGGESSSENVSDEDIIINKSSKKIHLSTKCSYAGTIKESNKLVKPRGELESYLADGYSICSYCNKNYNNGN